MKSRTLLALGTIASLVAPAAAHAVTFDVLAEGVLTGAGSYANGVGAPSVVWDDAGARFVMFFETEVTAAGCAEAWAIGTATSTDGFTWTAGKKVVGPVAGTVHPCGGRRPAAMIDEDGTRLLAYNVVDEVRDDQVALLEVDAGVRTARIVPELDGLVAPTLARFENEWILMGVRSDAADAAVLTARSTDTIAWTIDPSEAIPMGATPWALDGTLSPTLLCNDAVSYEWELYYGGWTSSDTSWTWGISDDASKWYVTPALDTWTDASAWQSWEAIKVGTATVVFYEDVDDLTGLPRIGVAATTPTWTATDAKSRHCRVP